MSLTRTPLLLAESDARFRALERAYRANPGDEVARSRLETGLRQAGRHGEADAMKLAKHRQTFLDSRRAINDVDDAYEKLGYVKGGTNAHSRLESKMRKLRPIFQKHRKEYHQAAEQMSTDAGHHLTAEHFKTPEEHLHALADLHGAYEFHRSYTNPTTQVVNFGGEGHRARRFRDVVNHHYPDANARHSPHRIHGGTIERHDVLLDRPEPHDAQS